MKQNINNKKNSVLNSKWQEIELTGKLLPNGQKD